MKLTIITVVKNDKKNLLITINSVLSQNFKKFEYIIYDGMSKDGTMLAVNKYLKKNVRYIRRKDKNYYDGLNYAIKSAKGKYIGILNAGDKYYNSKTLTKVNKYISTLKYDFIFGNLIFFGKKNFIYRIWKFPIKNLSKLSCLKIATPTLFIKKHIMLSNKYNISYDISSDTDFNIKLSKKNYRYLYLNIFLIFMKKGGLSTKYSFFFRKMKQDLVILKKHFKKIYLIAYFYKILIKLFGYRLFKIK